MSFYIASKSLTPCSEISVSDPRSWCSDPRTGLNGPYSEQILKSLTYYTQIGCIVKMEIAQSWVKV